MYTYAPHRTHCNCLCNARLMQRSIGNECTSGVPKHNDAVGLIKVLGTRPKYYINQSKSVDVTQCYTETQTSTPNSKQCRCRSTVARKNSLERPKPRKKSREDPGSEGWPVLFWLCLVEIIRVHGH